MDFGANLILTEGGDHHPPICKHQMTCSRDPTSTANNFYTCWKTTQLHYDVWMGYLSVKNARIQSLALASPLCPISGALQRHQNFLSTATDALSPLQTDCLGTHPLASKEPSYSWHLWKPYHPMYTCRFWSWTTWPETYLPLCSASFLQDLTSCRKQEKAPPARDMKSFDFRIKTKKNSTNWNKHSKPLRIALVVSNHITSLKLQPKEKKAGVKISSGLGEIKPTGANTQTTFSIHKPKNRHYPLSSIHYKSVTKKSYYNCGQKKLR